MTTAFGFTDAATTGATTPTTTRIPLTGAAGYPYPPGSKNLKIGFIATETSSRDIGLSTCGGAVPFAMDYIVQNQLLNDYTFEFVVNYTDCDEQSAAGITVEMITDHDVDVIIGPPCTSCRMGYGLLAFMNLYGWGQFGIMYVDDPSGFCDSLLTDTAASNLDTNFTLTYQVKLASISYSDLKAGLTKMKAKARIIVMCLEGVTKRQMLLAAYDNNMTTPDYVYIMMTMRGTGFGVQATSNYTTEVLDNGFTPIWVDVSNQPPDGRDDQAKQAATRLLVIDTASLVAIGTDPLTFKQEVFSRVKGWPFFCDTMQCQLLYNVTGAGNFISYLYDAFLFYAYAMNATLAQDPVGGLRNWTLFNELKLGVEFTGWSGVVAMTQNGSRIPRFFVTGIDGTGTPVNFVNLTYAFDGELMDATVLYDDAATSIWATRNGIQPADEPTCGFSGKACPISMWAQSGGYIIAAIVVAVLLVIILILIAIYAVREKRREIERLNAEWRVNETSLQKPRSRNEAQSMHSIHSSKSSISGAGSKFSFGSKHSDTDKMNYYLLDGEPNMAFKHKVVSKLSPTDHQELRMLRKLEHDNLHRFLGLCEHASPILTIWRLASRGSLEQVLVGSSMTIDGFFMYSLVRDLVEGLVYILKSPLKMHGHLSSTNCYIDDRWQLKVGGYGLSFIRSHEQTSRKEQLWFAPEKLREPLIHWDEAIDVYSFAIICSEIISRKTAFDMENRREKIEEVLYMVKKGGSVPLRPELIVSHDADVNPALLHLIRDCWTEEPNNRPNFATIKTLLLAMGADRKQNLMDHVFNILESYAETLEKEVQDRTGELTEEKKKSDILLYRMLPKQVADRLKLGQTVEPETYDSVTIFFSDVVKFTNLAAKCTPLQIVNLLNDLYSTFDQIIEEHGVYKGKGVMSTYWLLGRADDPNLARNTERLRMQTSDEIPSRPVETTAPPDPLQRQPTEASEGPMTMAEFARRPTDPMLEDLDDEPLGIYRKHLKHMPSTRKSSIEEIPNAQY
ncbi:unnamed protein product, partial [Mesorhabditis spiculigera]